MPKTPLAEGAKSRTSLLLLSSTTWHPTPSSLALSFEMQPVQKPMNHRRYQDGGSYQENYP